MWQSVFNSLKNGDVYFIVLSVLMFFALFCFFQRFILLQFVYNINFEKFIDKIKALVKSNEAEQALELCKKTSNIGFPRIAGKAVEAGIGDPTMVRGIIEEEVVAFVPRLDKGSSFLSLVGVLSVLVGVIGTISSLWNTLYSMEVVDTTQKQLSIGLQMSSSLSYTMCALIICISCVVMSFYIKSQAVNIANKIYHGVSVLHNLYPQQTGFGFIPNQVADTTKPSEDSTMEEGEEVFESGESTEVTPSDIGEFSEVDEIKDEEEII